MRACLLSLWTVLLVSCQQQLKEDELVGLWELEEFWLDGRLKESSDYFIDIHGDGTFAIAKESGDTHGIYNLTGRLINFSSADRRWLNGNWRAMRYQNRLELTGRGDYSEDLAFRGVNDAKLNTKLIFKKTAVVPDYQSIEDRVLGRWSLYKIRENGNYRLQNSTSLTIRQQSYDIHEKDSLVESGQLVINTRYKKLFFEGYDTAWKFRFYGGELRLINSKRKVEYALRRH